MMRSLCLALMIAAPAAAAPTTVPPVTVSAPAPSLVRGLADTHLAPASVVLAARGSAVLAQGQAETATDLFEAALAADPRNRAAFVGLARAAEAQGLPGKAIRLYREALQIEPNDLAALEGQSVVLARRGAIERARANLERIKVLCVQPCAAAQRVSAAIARGPDRVQTAEAPRSATPPVPQPVPVAPVAPEPRR
jgi:tetratricopeptide (TPR) repeat protein